MSETRRSSSLDSYDSGFSASSGGDRCITQEFPLIHSNYGPCTSPDCSGDEEDEGISIPTSITSLSPRCVPSLPSAQAGPADTSLPNDRARKSTFPRRPSPLSRSLVTVMEEPVADEVSGSSKTKKRTPLFPRAPVKAAALDEEGIISKGPRAIVSVGLAGRMRSSLDRMTRSGRTSKLMTV